MKLKLQIILGLCGLALCWGRPLQAAPRLSGVFGDHMVLQRGAAVPIWGWAEAGEKVTVEFAGQTKTATAGADGSWLVKLDAMPASTSGRTLSVYADKGSAKLQVTDILVGEVWLCSGQSNMAYSMAALKDSAYAEDLKTATFPLIRQGAVPRKPSLEPTNNIEVKWLVCTPETVSDFTAAGFYFARRISSELGVPVGLLHSSWGGTSAESWTSRGALSTVPEFKARAEEQVANLLSLPERVQAFPTALAAWEKQNGRVDAGNEGEQKGWHRFQVDPTGWRTTRINAKWRDSGLTNGGIAWLRKEVVVPAKAAGKKFRLDPGLVDDQYVTAYWNGVKVGETGRKPPQFYYGYINFDVTADQVRPGTNVVAFRFVVNTPDKAPVGRRAMQMGFVNLGITELSDECLVRVEKDFPALSKAALGARPGTPKGDAAHTASTLFGGMINPLIPFAIKGCLWYQGEQDASRAMEYRKLLPLMIRDWRQRWRLEFPFIVQQLPNWIAGGADSAQWAELREAQALTARTVPGCSISVGIDVGEANDVHPKNKRDVGQRLGLVALAKVYGRPVEYSGPVFESAETDGASLRLNFRFAEGLKSSDGAPLRHFTIAGPDKKFQPAKAVIEGDQVVVWSPSVKSPVAVRYAFINNPEGCNLSNSSGLPAMPFRTDEWANDK